MKPQPLTDEECDRLSAALKRLGDKRSMNLEQLDGFLATLVCGPEIVLPSEYLPQIGGDDLVSGDRLVARPIFQDFLSLICHWNVIADTLHSDDVYLPLRLEGENGTFHANDWASGFLRGVDLRRDQWTDLLGDKQHGGWLVPIFALAHEHDPDPTMRPYSEPVSTELRERN